jgi:DNA-directed RNA polymerase subunit RPC12/RpoP
MSDSFQCPKCGANYTRERRRVGKAVVCACGHKFLVPPAGVDVPQPDDRRTAPRNPSPVVPQPDDRGSAPRNPSSVPRSTPSRPRKPPAPSSDSSAEVLPLAEVVESAPPVPSGRWAEPVQPEPVEELPQAEIVYAADSYAEPAPLAGDLFSAGGAYGDSVGAGDPFAAPLAAPPPPVRQKKGGKPRRAAEDGGPVGFSHWVAYIVLFLLLPVAAIFTVFGLIQYRRGGSIVRAPQQSPAGPSPSSTQPGPAANEPARSGLAITVWNATKKSQTDEFSIEYRIDQGPLNPSSQYIWVVSAAQGKVEFPIPAAAWKARGKHAGKSSVGNLTPPYSSHIEEQLGTTRTRVSNEAQVVVGG